MLLLIFLLAQTLHPGEPYVRLRDGILVRVEHPLLGYRHSILIQAVTPRIIHISASQEDQEEDAPLSLMRIPGPQNPVPYEVYRRDTLVVFSTDSLHVVISTQTGTVRFEDAAGRTLLEEADAPRPPFVPDTAGGENAWHVSATFHSPAGECLYGLGQQQNGILNYKDQTVTLLQQNTSVAIPMVVSSRNYGVLWDNYSITRFGGPDDYQPLSLLTGGGLTATYADEKGVFATRRETTIDYPYLSDLRKFPDGYQFQNGVVTWSGNLSAPVSGRFRFLLYAGGYVKAWLGDSLILDRWRQCWNPETILFELYMVQGRPVKFRLEWKPDGSASFIQLRQQPPWPEAYKNTYTFTSEVGDAVNYYFVRGSNLDEVVGGYRLLTGKTPLMPEWAMGLWQSRERYRTQAELLGTVREFRARHIPLDNIVLDWQYWKPDQWGSDEFDTVRFPNPDRMLETLHDSLHAHFMISVWPKFYVGTRNYDLFSQKGWLYTRNVQNGQKDWIGYVSTFYDAFNPRARSAFWNLIDQRLFNKGVDAWWLDATEPDILSNASIRERKALMEPHALGSSARYFNAFPLENARAVYEGQRSAGDKRVFILTRSAFAGQQRYAAATWSGDIGARWEDLRNQITAGLNFSISGIPWWTMDIGGFAVEHRYEHPDSADLEEWRELNARWFAFGAFCPLLRVHGQFPYREVFHIAPDNHPAYRTILYYDRLRYRLLPYLYSMDGWTWLEDYTLMRPLAMDFGSDSSARVTADEFMLGPALLVCPVYHYKARSRSVYLPSGAGWYDAYSGHWLKAGERIDAPAPYERIPLYVRAGSIVPLGPALEYTGQRLEDTLTLLVYEGRDADFTLYEDGDTDYQYEQGAYSTIPMHYQESTHMLTIGVREGSFPGMLQNHVFRVIWITKEHPAPLDAGQPASVTLSYSGSTLSAPGPPSDR